MFMYAQKIYVVKVESWGRSVSGSHTVATPTGTVTISYKNLRLRRRADGCTPTTQKEEGVSSPGPRAGGATPRNA